LREGWIPAGAGAPVSYRPGKAACRRPQSGKISGRGQGTMKARRPPTVAVAPLNWHEERDDTGRSEFWRCKSILQRAMDPKKKKKSKSACKVTFLLLLQFENLNQIDVDVYY
jgi:hypothetical protein